MRLAASVVVALLPFSGILAGDGVTLTVERGPSPDQAYLTWIGGNPTYAVHGAPSAANLADPINLLGQTAQQEWVDSSLDAVSYYLVLTGCDDTFEPNDGCTTVTTLQTVGSNGMVSYNTMTLYPMGDDDYYRIVATESDASCSCCDAFCFDEDFRLRVQLQVPAGASFIFCTGPTCGQVDDNCVTVAGGSSDFWEYVFDGSCGGVDSYEIFVHVYDDEECVPYTLSYTFETGCF